MVAAFQNASLVATLAVPSKAAILSALMSGHSLPASELAYRAAVSYQTTSYHLKQLLEDGYVRVRQTGRHRYYEISGAEVADVLEKLSLLTPSLREQRSPKGQTEAMRQARICYDHIAGRFGVALLQSFRAHHYLCLAAPKSEELAITMQGRNFFAALGIDVDRLQAGRRKFACECIDWSERTPHLAGALGCAVMQAFEARGWITRHPTDRALAVTPAARRAVPKLLGVNVRLITGVSDVAPRQSSRKSSGHDAVTSVEAPKPARRQERTH